MFNDIGYKIKALAYIIAIISIVGGIVWLIYSYMNWNEYKDFYESFLSSDTYYLKAHTARIGIRYSLILLISGTLSSFFIFGFGELIEKITIISNYYTKVMNDKKMQEHMQEKVMYDNKEMTRAEMQEQLNK